MTKLCWPRWTMPARRSSPACKAAQNTHSRALSAPLTYAYRQGVNRKSMTEEDTRSLKVSRRFHAQTRGLTVVWHVAIVEGVLWQDQDCCKIRPLVLKLHRAHSGASHASPTYPSSTSKILCDESGVFKVR